MGKPVVMSVAGCYLGEIEEAVNSLRQHLQNIALLHCHLKYPTAPRDANLAVIKTLMQVFPECVIGYSDHTEHPFSAPVGAVAIGAKVIEKHITLNKKMKGPDHFFALEPNELKIMVKQIREAEKIIAKGGSVPVSNELLGSSSVGPSENELYLREFAFTTIISMNSIKKGERLTKKNIRVLRPGKLPRGLHPRFYTLLVEKGYKVTRDIPLGTPLTLDDLIEH
jgi:N-acetylneuraminate synthase